MNWALNTRKAVILGILLIGALLFVPCQRIEASPIQTIVDPGLAGSTFSYKDFTFTELNGSAFAGQTLSLDILFSDSKFLVAAGGPIDLHISQTGDLGEQPENFAMTGYLLDSGGNQLNVPFSYGGEGSMPAQEWPAGTISPAESFQGKLFAGTEYPDPTNPSAGYYIDPVVFSGLHLDLTLPVNESRSIIGARLVLANFDFPIYVSPNPMPEFYVSIFEPSSVSLLALGFFALGGLGRRLKRRPSDLHS